MVKPPDNTIEVKVTWNDGGGVTEHDANTIVRRHLNSLMKEMIAAGVKSPAIFSGRVG